MMNHTICDIHFHTNWWLLLLCLGNIIIKMAPMTEPICMNNKCNSLDKVRKYEIRLSHDVDEQIIRAQIV